MATLVEQHGTTTPQIEDRKMISEKLFQLYVDAIGSRCATLSRYGTKQILGQINHETYKVGLRVRFTEKTRIISMELDFGSGDWYSVHLSKFVTLFNNEAKVSRLILRSHRVLLHSSHRIDIGMPGAWFISQWIDRALGTWTLLHPALERIMAHGGKAYEEFTRHVEGKLNRPDILA
jgi:hypothetical protein